MRPAPLSGGPSGGSEASSIRPESPDSRAGVQVGLADYIGAAAAVILIAARMTTYGIAARIPVISQAADRSLVRKLAKQLARYGHAEFTTNADAYRPAHT